jgi:hypothetical protein
MTLWLLRLKHPEIAIQSSITKRLIALCLGISFIMGAQGTLVSVRQEIGERDFSGSKKMADFIKARGLDREILISQISRSTAVLPYLPNTALWAANTKEFVRYNHDVASAKQMVPFETMYLYTRTELPTNQPVYVLAASAIKEPITLSKKMSDYFRLVYFANGFRDQLWLYKLTRPKKACNLGRFTVYPFSPIPKRLKVKITNPTVRQPNTDDQYCWLD